MRRKKFLSLFVKTVIGVASALLVYIKLRHDLTPERMKVLGASVFSLTGMGCLVACLLLIPVNWGIESLKWKWITDQVERINFATATRSVYSGVCLGNLAPGRATEFIAKVLYFRPEHRPQVTILHFVGGLFQFSVTIIAGLASLFYFLNRFEAGNTWMPVVASVVSVLVLIALVLAVWKIDVVLHYVIKKFSKGRDHTPFEYSFSAGLVARLFGFSVLRYGVFFFQFFLLLYLFGEFKPGLQILAEISLYFLITSTLPMISVIEAAIRAAVALVVFRDSGISDAALTLSSAMIWLVNIIVPSIAGYIFLVQKNFNFKVFGKDK